MFLLDCRITIKKRDNYDRRTSHFGKCEGLIARPTTRSFSFHQILAVDIDRDDDPTETVLEGLKQGFHEAITGQTLPLSQLWDGIDDNLSATDRN
ncbi:MAG: hypothetical protein EAZ09_23645 [Oscillatoriales cyanobacterium]|nr:MAG: hypothetical protein EAZ09_23645 [Oscillatoriales cyanobacterium]